jgi:hypothetical protein
VPVGVKVGRAARVGDAIEARKRYLIVACTVITDVPEAVGP